MHAVIDKYSTDDTYVFYCLGFVCVKQCLGFVDLFFLQALMLKCENQEIQDVWDSVLQTYKE